MFSLGIVPAHLPLPANLTVDRVVIAWLNMMYAGTMRAAGEENIHWARLRVQRQSQAQRPYDSAIRSLVLVQRLLTPEGTQWLASDAGEPAAKPSGFEGTAGRAA